MKMTSWCAMAVIVNLFVDFSGYAQSTNQPAGNLNLKNLTTDKVLNLYRQMAHVDLVMASNVQSIHRITLRAEGVTAETAEHLIEQALLKQAGIVLTRVDDKHVSVTYNDRLELESAQ